MLKELIPRGTCDELKAGGITSVMRENLKALGRSRIVCCQQAGCLETCCRKSDSRFLQDVSFSYKKTRVLNDVNLDVHQGEIARLLVIDW